MAKLNKKYVIQGSAGREEMDLYTTKDELNGYKGKSISIDGIQSWYAIDSNLNNPSATKKRLSIEGIVYCGLKTASKPLKKYYVFKQHGIHEFTVPEGATKVSYRICGAGSGIVQLMSPIITTNALIPLADGGPYGGHTIRSGIDLSNVLLKLADLTPAKLNVKELDSTLMEVVNNNNANSARETKSRISGGNTILYCNDTEVDKASGSLFSLAVLTEEKDYTNFHNRSRYCNIVNIINSTSDKNSDYLPEINSSTMQYLTQLSEPDPTKSIISDIPVVDDTYYPLQNAVYQIRKKTIKENTDLPVGILNRYHMMTTDNQLPIIESYSIKSNNNTIDLKYTLDDQTIRDLPVYSSFVTTTDINHPRFNGFYYNMAGNDMFAINLGSYELPKSSTPKLDSDSYTTVIDDISSLDRLENIGISSSILAINDFDYKYKFSAKSSYSNSFLKPNTNVYAIETDRNLKVAKGRYSTYNSMVGDYAENYKYKNYLIPSSVADLIGINDTSITRRYDGELKNQLGLYNDLNGQQSRIYNDLLINLGYTTYYNINKFNYLTKDNMASYSEFMANMFTSAAEIMHSDGVYNGVTGYKYGFAIPNNNTSQFNAPFIPFKDGYKDKLKYVDEIRKSQALVDFPASAYVLAPTKLDRDNVIQFRRHIPDEKLLPQDFRNAFDDELRVSPREATIVYNEGKEDEHVYTFRYGGSLKLNHHKYFKDIQQENDDKLIKSTDDLSTIDKNFFMAIGGRLVGSPSEEKTGVIEGCKPGDKIKINVGKHGDLYNSYLKYNNRVNDPWYASKYIDDEEADGICILTVECAQPLVFNSYESVEALPEGDRNYLGLYLLNNGPETFARSALSKAIYTSCTDLSSAFLTNTTNNLDYSYITNNITNMKILTNNLNPIFYKIKQPTSYHVSFTNTKLLGELIYLQPLVGDDGFYDNENSLFHPSYVSNNFFKNVKNIKTGINLITGRANADNINDIIKSLNINMSKDNMFDLSNTEYIECSPFRQYGIGGAIANVYYKLGNIKTISPGNSSYIYDCGTGAFSRSNILPYKYSLKKLLTTLLYSDGFKNSTIEKIDRYIGYDDSIDYSTPVFIHNKNALIDSSKGIFAIKVPKSLKYLDALFNKIPNIIKTFKYFVLDFSDHDRAVNNNIDSITLDMLGVSDFKKIFIYPYGPSYSYTGGFDFGDYRRKPKFSSSSPSAPSAPDVYAPDDGDIGGIPKEKITSIQPKLNTNASGYNATYVNIKPVKRLTFSETRYLDLSKFKILYNEDINNYKNFYNDINNKIDISELFYKVENVLDIKNKEFLLRTVDLMNIGACKNFNKVLYGYYPESKEQDIFFNKLNITPELHPTGGKSREKYNETFVKCRIYTFPKINTSNEEFSNTFKDSTIYSNELSPNTFKLGDTYTVDGLFKDATIECEVQPIINRVLLSDFSADGKIASTLNHTFDFKDINTTKYPNNEHLTLDFTEVPPDKRTHRLDLDSVFGEKVNKIKTINVIYDSLRYNTISGKNIAPYGCETLKFTDVSIETYYTTRKSHKIPNFADFSHSDFNMNTYKEENTIKNLYLDIVIYKNYYNFFTKDALSQYANLETFEFRCVYRQLGGDTYKDFPEYLFKNLPKLKSLRLKGLNFNTILPKIMSFEDIEYTIKNIPKQEYLNSRFPFTVTVSSTLTTEQRNILMNYKKTNSMYTIVFADLPDIDRPTPEPGPTPPKPPIIDPDAPGDKEEYPFVP